MPVEWAGPTQYGFGGGLPRFRHRSMESFQRRHTAGGMKRVLSKEA